MDTVTEDSHQVTSFQGYSSSAVWAKKTIMAIVLPLVLLSPTRALCATNDVEALKSILDDLRSSDSAKRARAKDELGLDRQRKTKWLPQLRRLLASADTSDVQRRDAALMLCAGRDKQDIQAIAAELQRRIGEEIREGQTYSLAELLTFVSVLGGEKNAPLLCEAIGKVQKFHGRDSHLPSAIALATIRLSLHDPEGARSLLGKREEALLSRTKSIEGKPTGDWRGNIDPQKELFGIRYSKGVLAEKAPLEIALGLVEGDEHYWVRLFARALAVRLIDMKKSGYSNWRLQERTPGLKLKTIDHFRFAEAPDILWFPVHDEDEMSAVLKVWDFRLKHGLAGKGELASDTKRTRRFLEERNERWLEAKKRFASRALSDEEVLRHLAGILRGILQDERTEIPILGGDF